MNVLVLGGCGSQGRAALYDLSRNESVDQITCADIQLEIVDSFDFIDKTKIQTVRIDANDQIALTSKLGEGFDVVLDFLPPQCILTVAEAAINSGVNLVNTNYAYNILDLDHAAKEKGIAIIPECGLDPGIDLVLYQYSLKYFDEVSELNSYCGGIPEKAACDNPLNYKISWNIDAVLKNQIRDATLIADSVHRYIPAKDLIERDLSKGLMAMSMGVAYPACIAAEMIVRGHITKKGVLSPATDVPCDLFLNQLNKRGITINKTIEQSK